MIRIQFEYDYSAGLSYQIPQICLVYVANGFYQKSNQQGVCVPIFVFCFQQGR